MSYDFWLPVSPTINLESVHTLPNSNVYTLPYQKHRPCRFYRSGCSGNKNVAVFCDIFTGCQRLSNAYSVSGRTGNQSLRYWHRTVPVLQNESILLNDCSCCCIQCQPAYETILIWNFLHAAVIHLGTECICHRTEAHFNEFIDCTLVCHDFFTP